MGAAMRIDRWRYVAWCRYGFTAVAPNFADCVGSELYDYLGIAPNAVDKFDQRNLAGDGNHSVAKNWPHHP